MYFLKKPLIQNSGKIDALLDWPAFCAILKRGLGRSGLGPSGYDPLILFKCLLVGQWHGLSDPKLERALKVRLDFMLFCGLDLHGAVPDETTHCRFRNALVGAGVYDELLAEVCHQIEAHGLKLQEADAAIIDATLMESAARPRSYIEAPQDREEGETKDDPDVHYSADEDARWVKKGSKSTLGFKGFARTDEEGFVDKVHVTPANAAESPQFGTMIEGGPRTACAGRQSLRKQGQPSGSERATSRQHHAQGRPEQTVAPIRETLQQANLQTSLRPTPCALFRCRQNSCADDHGRHLAEPAQGRKQDYTQPANPGNRINRTHQSQSASDPEAEPKK